MYVTALRETKYLPHQYMYNKKSMSRYRVSKS